MFQKQNKYSKIHVSIYNDKKSQLKLSDKLQIWATFILFYVEQQRLYIIKRLMDPEENEPRTLCRKCQNYIRTKNFLIHQTRCQGSNFQIPRSQNRIFNSSRMSNRMQSSARKNTQRVQQSNQQKIPCHFCGYLQTFAELDTHPSSCQHREQQCPRCHNSFPKSLLSQHNIVCTANHRPMFRHHDLQSDDEQQYSQIQSVRRMPRVVARQNSSPFELFAFMQQQLAINRIQRRFSQQQGHRHRHGPPQRNRIVVLNNLHNLIRLLAQDNFHQEQGLSKQEINKFSRQKYDHRLRKQNEQDMCVICYCQFQSGQQFMSLPCKHIFHPECVSTWLQKNSTCPLCKKDYGSKKQQNEQESNPRSGQNGRRIFMF